MGKRSVLLTMGPLLVVLGGWPLFYIYAFAAMVPPHLQGWDYWSLVLSRMFDFSDGGWVSLLSSIVVSLGCALCLWGVMVLVVDVFRCLTLYDLKLLFIVTAFLEALTGLCLLILPAVPLALLLGSIEAAPEALLIGRIAGAALFSIGIASWLARDDRRTPAQLGLLIGILLYNVALLLGYAAVALHMVGLALWPAVVLHSLLAVWCIKEWLLKTAA